jgi:hypothetical protein
MAVEAGDACHQGDAAATVLLGKGPGEKAPDVLVGGSEEPVDGTVYLSGWAVRVLLASWALARVRGRKLVLVRHKPLPPCDKLSDR